MPTTTKTGKRATGKRTGVAGKATSARVAAAKRDFEKLYRRYESKDTTERAPDYQKKFSQIIVRAWTEPTFEEQLMANPTKVMRENGIPIPPGVVVKSDQFLIPPRPAGLDIELLSSAELKLSCFGSYSSFSCPGCTAACAGSGFC